MVRVHGAALWTPKSLGKVCVVLQHAKGAVPPGTVHVPGVLLKPLFVQHLTPNLEHHKEKLKHQFLPKK